MKSTGGSYSRDTLLQQAVAGGEQIERRLKNLLVAQATGQRMSVSQFSALRLLDSKGIMSSRQLGRELFITSGAVTQLIDAMSAAGYVERCSDPADRRVTNLVLTESGKQKLHQMQSGRTKFFEAIHQYLSDDEISELHVIQDKMLKALETMEASAKGKTA